MGGWWHILGKGVEVKIALVGKRFYYFLVVFLVQGGSLRIILFVVCAFLGTWKSAGNLGARLRG